MTAQCFLMGFESFSITLFTYVYRSCILTLIFPPIKLQDRNQESKPRDPQLEMLHVAEMQRLLLPIFFSPVA